MQVETNNNNEEIDPGLSEVFERLVEKPVKPVVSRSEINYVNREHKAIVRSIADTTGRIINLGKKLARMRDRFEYGEWIPFVERELEFSVRTVQRYIRAAELSADLVLGTDPAEFLAKVWGHKPKEEAANNTTRASYCDDKTTGSGGTASEGSEDDDHDGEGEPFDNSTEGAKLLQPASSRRRSERTSPSTGTS
jgi:hypothetical protein